MRSFLAMLVLAGIAFAGTTSAQAEKRVFIISNQADAYGVDRCLASGAACGAAAAAAYCRSREFAQAASYRKVDKEEITGAVPTGSTCPRGNCDDYVAIECSR
jgi:hypothetical protein